MRIVLPIRRASTWLCALLTAAPSAGALAQDASAPPPADLAAPSSPPVDAAPAEPPSEVTPPPAPAAAPPGLVAPPAPPAPLTWHGADLPPREPYGKTWDTWGHVRVRLDAMNDPKLDELQTTSGRALWASSRAIYGARFTPIEGLAIEIEAEELSSAFAGDKTAVGTAADPEPFRVTRSDFKDIILTHPRALSVTYTDPRFGRIAAGVQSFSWGLGMLANDGKGDPEFGDPDQGNINARLLFATSPWRDREGAPAGLRGLSLFVAGDVVIRDDNAWVYRGDLAAAGLVGLRVNTRQVEAGALAVGRWQKDRRDATRPDDGRPITVAFPVDAYVRATFTRPSSPVRLRVEAEGALIAGRTERPYLDATVPDGARVLSGGMVARLRVDHDPGGFTAKAEVGLASGDDDLRDATSRTFSMHSDHEVGLLLFEQVIPLLTARAADRGVDPALLARPTPGARNLVNQGQVSNAVYVFPTVRYRPQPLDLLELRLGYLSAWSAGASYDPFLSGLAGGYPVGWGGADAARRHLGQELDVAARVRIPGPGNFAAQLGAEGAVLLSGAALDALGNGPLATVRGHLDLTW